LNRSARVRLPRWLRFLLLAAVLLTVAAGPISAAVAAAVNYVPITPSLADKTVVLTGKDLTVNQVVDVARFGAQVAARVLDMLRGSYLFDRDDKRIIQDPESLRASFIRQGSAWASWAQLRDDVQIQMNSSDHNPAVRVGASPTDSWELSTPQLAQFYVKGSARNNYQHGYIFSSANWDPYPMANDIEAFGIALANMDIAVAQRMLRFTNKFFTVMQPPPESPGEPGRFHVTDGSDIDSAALMQEIQTLVNPVAPQGNALIQNVEDLQGQTRLKAARARAVVADTAVHVAASASDFCELGRGADHAVHSGRELRRRAAGGAVGNLPHRGTFDRHLFGV